MSNEKTKGLWFTAIKPDTFDIEDNDLVYTRQAANLPKEKTHIKNKCNVPLTNINIDYKGRIFICDCDGHLPYPVGNISNVQSLDDIYQNDIAKDLISTVTENKFIFCHTERCGIQFNDKISPLNNLTIHLGIDPGCNYACPSCRERIVLDNSEEFLNPRKVWIDNIYKIIESASSRKITIMLGSNGDPFVSELYVYALEVFSKLDNIRFNFRTNGSRLLKHADKIRSLKDRIDRIDISIDAATKETYEKVRRPGKWENLLENLQFLKDNGIFSTASFVVQVDNFREMPAFVEFCYQYNIKPNFALLVDWGTWHNFDEHVVHTPSSPYYDEFRQIISTMPGSLVNKFIL